MISPATADSRPGATIREGSHDPGGRRSIERSQPQAEPSEGPPAKKKRHLSEVQKAYQKSHRRACNTRKQMREFESLVSDNTAAVGCYFRRPKANKLALFPAISEELAIEREKRSQEQAPGPEIRPPVTPREPTEEEHKAALEEVERSFHAVREGYVHCNVRTTFRIVFVVELLKIASLSPAERAGLDCLCAFVHACRPFVDLPGPPAAADIMAAIGWSEDSTRLDILPQYRNEDAVRTDPEGYAKLLEDSARAGEVLWDMFTTLGNVAAENTRKAIRKLGGLTGPVSTLAFPSQAFWNNNTDDKHLNTGEEADAQPALSLDSSFLRSNRPARSAWRPKAIASTTASSSFPTSSKQSTSRQTPSASSSSGLVSSRMAAWPLLSMAILRAWPCAYSPRSSAS
ncbi:hypothetical protein PTTG_08271 [Puccinia triticina 1-1 BBBD Race 1]|uniref:Tet-like 2OG-Fe(II) oxygenase domain-containing protein n=1 Tax=Puccinia triticina (isolate 1-1 / race 1 (BBBD)) TaxID=630390 RepID=A0A180G309_PUCT1|nr:hypothetical protein PTTG_08271 [Puccinia triticina 1-1 BBBD Race 1]